LVFDIGTLEMFGGISSGAPESIKNTRKLMDLMDHEGVALPPPHRVAFSEFASDGGWGRPFSPSGLRTIRGAEGVEPHAIALLAVDGGRSR
jgi:hypothetical protein